MTVWVVGEPRSGTSMMMQMLEAGGLVPLIPPSGARTALPVAANPRGYYEHPSVQFQTITALSALTVGCVKVFARLVPAVLAAGVRADRAVVMRRPRTESAESWAAHFAPSEYAPGPERLAFAKAALLAASVPVIEVAFHDAIDFPNVTAARLAAFIGGLDVEAMAAVPDPTLRHYGG